MPPIIGIDLGTTQCRAAYFDGKLPRIIPNDRGLRQTPSAVSFPKQGKILIGESALEGKLLRPENTVTNAKFYLGKDKQYLIHGQYYRPEAICALLLCKIKEDASRFLGEEIGQAVLTVPAHFSHAARKALQKAGKMAGLEVMRILNEPTASALCWAVLREEKKHLLVYDLGGGTIDVSLLAKQGRRYRVLATSGSDYPGGLVFNQLIREEVLKDLPEARKKHFSADPYFSWQLDQLIEKVKKELTFKNSGEISIPCLDIKGEMLQFKKTIERGRFEKLIKKPVEQTLRLIKQTLKDSGIKAKQVDLVLAVGGSSRIPYVRKQLERIFPGKLASLKGPDEMVAQGAALSAALISGDLRDVRFEDINPRALGVEIEGGRFMPIIPRNSPLPVARSRVFTTVSQSQTQAEIHILQGNSPKAAENESLGRIFLSELAAENSKDPRIEVLFQIDGNGLFHIRAQDLYSLKASEMRHNLAFSLKDVKQGKNTLAERVIFLLNFIQETELSEKKDLFPVFKNISQKSKAALQKADQKALFECRIALEALKLEIEKRTD